VINEPRRKNNMDYKCTVEKAGVSATATETKSPVVFIELTDSKKAFSHCWFYMKEDGKKEGLAVALAAINGQRQVDVTADPPNQNNSPYTSIAHIYLVAS
jgi:hypothetical protein